MLRHLPNLVTILRMLPVAVSAYEEPYHRGQE